MGSQKEVNIELVKGALNDYVIKDKDKIVVGRFTIGELDKENKRSTIRFKFYRENNYELLKASIDMILKTIFKDGNINKVNFLVSETSDISGFLDLGFTLEAILSENLMVNGTIVDELGLGITRNEYISSIKNNIVHMKGNRITIRLSIRNVRTENDICQCVRFPLQPKVCIKVRILIAAFTVRI